MGFTLFDISAGKLCFFQPANMVGMTVGNQEVINVRKGGVVVVKQAVRTMITAIDQEMRLVFHNKKIRLVQGF